MLREKPEHVTRARSTGRTVRHDNLLQPLVQRTHNRNAPHVIVTTPQGKFIGLLLRDEADRLLAGEPPYQIWRDCECCPGRWTTAQATEEIS